MQEHKQPGKSSAAASQGHGHGDDHAPGPGKQTRVEQAGPIASAASAADSGGSTSASTSKTAVFNEGNVHIEATVGIKLTKGRGKISMDVSRGSVQIGNDHMSMDFKSPDAATGKSMAVSGASVTTSKNGSHQSATAMKHGYLGKTYTTEWTVKHKDWTATFSVSSFAGVKPPKPEKPKHRGIIDSVIHAIGKGIETAAHAVADISESIVKSAPEWGPYVVAAAAAVAGGAQSVASG